MKDCSCSKIYLVGIEKTHAGIVISRLEKSK
jgi:hypothetical protein